MEFERLSTGRFNSTLATGEMKLMPDTAALQLDLCREHDVAFSPPAPGSRVGVELQTLGCLPLHGLRSPAQGEASGWYFWAGDAQTEVPDFYQPLSVEHLEDRCPLVLRFLGLPARWRFLTDGDYVDVWYDDELLQRQSG